MKIFYKIILITILLTGNLFGGGNNDLLLLPSPKFPIKLVKKAMYLDIFDTGKRIIAVGEQGFIIYTDDYGKTWHQADVPVRVTLTGVYFPDEKNGWTVGNCGVILHTEDGGKTWKKQLDGNEANRIIVKKLKEIIENKEYDNTTLSIDDLKYFLKDSEKNIKEGPTWPFLNLWFRDKNFGIAIGAFGRIFLTKNGGKTWESLLGKLNNPDGFHYYDIGELKEKIFIVGEGGIIFKGNKDAERWLSITSPSDSSFFGMLINKKNSSIYVYGMKGVAFKSDDLGVSWKKVFSLNNINKIIVSSIILENDTLCFLTHEGFFFCKDKNKNDFYKKNVRMLGCISLIEKNNKIFAACANGVHIFKVNSGD